MDEGAGASVCKGLMRGLLGASSVAAATGATGAGLPKDASADISTTAVGREKE